MKKTTFLFTSCLFAVSLLLMSCGSSEESTQQKEQQLPPTTTSQTQQQPASKTDTTSVSRQTTPKQEYDPRTSTPPKQSAIPTGKYSVQIGAYKMSDNAERVAAMARDRFGKNVYTSQDKTADLYKVMVGDFTNKDDARRFRDDMAQRFPEDYKNAWVAENNQQ